VTLQSLGFVIAFPIAPALLALLFRRGKALDLVVWTGALVFGGAALTVAFQFWGSGSTLLLLPLDAPLLDRALLGLECLVLAFLFWRALSMRSKAGWVPGLIAAQAAAVVYLDLVGGLPKSTAPLAVDPLGVLLLVVAGVVGGLVALYSISYMKEEQAHHPERPDQRGLFFFLIFLFLGAMAGIALSNSLAWLFFFWEITTLCSYLLIRTRGDEASIRNSDLALALNVLGGAFFAAGLLWLALGPGPKTGDLQALVASGRAALPVAVLLGLAGLVKSAQLPFHKWLLGAMVAPTPVSALLHASTMVKAGVFLLLRFSPVYQGTLAGGLLAGVGAATFLAASLLAVAERDAKRVLAYSTIANLGLMVACAGIGGRDALWAGMLLMVFHAVAKGLLFLAVGSVEHRLGSRDIEDMQGLLQRKRILGGMMVVGILGMFLAPFGMLTAKWKVLEAMAESAPLIAIVVAFGSAPTLFFWAKWLGALVAMPAAPKPRLERIPRVELGVLGALAALTLAATVAVPALSHLMVEPYLARLFPAAMPMDLAPLAVMLCIALGMLGLPLLLVSAPWGGRSPAYLAGANTGHGFVNSLHQPQEARLHNYYLSSLLHPAELGRAALWTGGALALAAAAAGVWS
jgi:ech hydrogenase subunit A